MYYLNTREVGTLLEEVQKSIAELDRFGKIVKLFCYSPFSTANCSLENAVSIAESNITSELEEFLKSNIKVSSKVTLGINDPKLGAMINEKTNINCVCNDVISEITRGIRTHFYKMIDNLNKNSCINAQIGLGHNVSRCKIKYNVNKADNMIIQAASMLEQLDKDINTFSQRIREWYSYHFPELYPILKDNFLFAKCTYFIGDRNKLTEDHIEELNNIIGSEDNNELSLKILQVSKSSIGMDINDIDLINIKNFSLRVIHLMEYRKSLFDYLISKMNLIAPNLSSVIGETVGAKLISQAGSLINLAKCPASTVQILGAEKSLFRALKTRGKTPKYGLIYHSSFIGRAPTRYKGRISRFLAHKCSIACRIDSFSDNPCDIVGKKLHEQIEERLQYFQKGEPEDNMPRKNCEVMEEAVQ
ncbi:hypothetical protein HZS_2882, partial [Henneguya salminicola]